MSSGAITIHGGKGADTINFAFTAYGTNTLRYAQQFANTVNGLLLAGDTITQVTQGAPSALAHSPVSQPNIYELMTSTVASGSQTFNITNAGYVIDSIGGNVQINAVGGSDTVLVAAINPHTTVHALGSNNRVIFVDGNNEFIGDTAPGATGDTIVGGSGFDTINTGSGASSVNSGTGDALIYLNDTNTTSAYNDTAWLDDGKSVVVANGAGDVVIATTEGQTVDGGVNETSTSFLTVALLPNSDATPGGLDSVNAGAGITTVEDMVGGNTVNGGSGDLFFLSGATVADTINTGTGYSLLYGNSGVDLTLGTQAGDTASTTSFVAGIGNETLNGASATSALTLFGGSDTTGSDSLVGGSGNDTLIAGVGSETLVGGTGANTFLIDSSIGGASITLADFGTNLASDTVAFSGFSASDVASAISGGVEGNNGFVVTFANTTTVTFTGVTSASELNGHIITF